MQGDIVIDNETVTVEGTLRVDKVSSSTGDAVTLDTVTVDTLVLRAKGPLPEGDVREWLGSLNGLIWQESDKRNEVLGRVIELEKVLQRDESGNLKLAGPVRIEGSLTLSGQDDSFIGVASMLYELEFALAEADQRIAQLNQRISQLESLLTSHTGRISLLMTALTRSPGWEEMKRYLLANAPPSSVGDRSRPPREEEWGLPTDSSTS